MPAKAEPPGPAHLGCMNKSTVTGQARLSIHPPVPVAASLAQLAATPLAHAADERLTAPVVDSRPPLTHRAALRPVALPLAALPPEALPLAALPPAALRPAERTHAAAYQVADTHARLRTPAHQTRRDDARHCGKAAQKATVGIGDRVRRATCGGGPYGRAPWYGIGGYIPGGGIIPGGGYIPGGGIIPGGGYIPGGGIIPGGGYIPGGGRCQPGGCAPHGGTAPVAGSPGGRPPAAAPSPELADGVADRSVGFPLSSAINASYSESSFPAGLGAPAASALRLPLLKAHSERSSGIGRALAAYHGSRGGFVSAVGWLLLFCSWLVCGEHSAPVLRTVGRARSVF
jgi:hypothetical protein